MIYNITVFTGDMMYFRPVLFKNKCPVVQVKRRMCPWVFPWLNKTGIRVMRNKKIHRIRPNFKSARSKFYDECLIILSIDGASTEIFCPQIEPQDLYFSGNRHFHAIHTDVLIHKVKYMQKTCFREQNYGSTCDRGLKNL